MCVVSQSGDLLRRVDVYIYCVLKVPRTTRLKSCRDITAQVKLSGNWWKAPPFIRSSKYSDRVTVCRVPGVHRALERAEHELSFQLNLSALEV